MTKDEAHQLATGYVWAKEDSGFATVPPAGETAGECTASLEFARAFATGYDDYNAERRGYMVSVRNAYENWQGSGGVTIFSRTI